MEALAGRNSLLHFVALYLGASVVHISNDDEPNDSGIKPIVGQKALPVGLILLHKVASFG